MTRKELIVEKAIDLFAQEGFENTSIQKLAEASGVAQGLLYRHFKNKNDLLLYLIHAGMTQIATTLEPYNDASLGFADAFGRHISLSFGYLRSHGRLWKVLHMVRQNTAFMQSLGLSFDPVQPIIRPISKKLKAEGMPDAEMKAWLIFALVDGVTGLYLLHPDKYPLEKLKKFITGKIANNELFSS